MYAFVLHCSHDKDRKFVFENKLRCLMLAQYEVRVCILIHERLSVFVRSNGPAARQVSMSATSGTRSDKHASTSAESTKKGDEFLGVQYLVDPKGYLDEEVYDFPVTTARATGLNLKRCVSDIKMLHSTSSSLKLMLYPYSYEWKIYACIGNIWNMHRYSFELSA